LEGYIFCSQLILLIENLIVWSLAGRTQNGHEEQEAIDTTDHACNDDDKPSPICLLCVSETSHHAGDEDESPRVSCTGQSIRPSAKAATKGGPNGTSMASTLKSVS
jgi:hypothetical protein